MDYRWSLGVIVGLPVAGLGVILLLLSAWWLHRYARRHDGDSYSDSGIARGLAWTAIGSILVVIAATAWFMWPYSGEYHQWRTESGTVTQIDSRLLASDTKGGGTTQRFVVELDGDRQRSCDDTRCAQVEVGDVLTISCKRAWQYSGTHGYDCNFVSVKRGNR
jgi:hypothetical protein